jgi:hypothetical protein
MARSDRRPGRPPRLEAPARVHVTMSAADYDRALRLAHREAVTVPELVRRGLAHVLERDSQK